MARPNDPSTGHQGPRVFPGDSFGERMNGPVNPFAGFSTQTLNQFERQPRHPGAEGSRTTGQTVTPVAPPMPYDTYLSHQSAHHRPFAVPCVATPRPAPGPRASSPYTPAATPWQPAATTSFSPTQSASAPPIFSAPQPRRVANPFAGTYLGHESPGNARNRMNSEASSFESESVDGEDEEEIAPEVVELALRFIDLGFLRGNRSVLSLATADDVTSSPSTPRHFDAAVRRPDPCRPLERPSRAVTSSTAGISSTVRESPHFSNPWRSAPRTAGSLGESPVQANNPYAGFNTQLYSIDPTGDRARGNEWYAPPPRHQAAHAELSNHRTTTSPSDHNSPLLYTRSEVADVSRPNTQQPCSARRYIPASSSAPNTQATSPPTSAWGNNASTGSNSASPITRTVLRAGSRRAVSRPFAGFSALTLPNQGATVESSALNSEPTASGFHPPGWEDHRAALDLPPSYDEVTTTGFVTLSMTTDDDLPTYDSVVAGTEAPPTRSRLSFNF